MNKWTEKSVYIANSDGYLDKLQTVYPVILTEEREIDKEILDDLKKTFDALDNENLIKKLLTFEKFPIKDPYVAFLRRNKGEFIKKNPKTVARIAAQLYSLGFDEVIKGITEPKEFNRQIGVLFRKRVPKIGFPMLPESEFEVHKGICFLLGSDNVLKNYAETKLGYDIEKGIDLIAKAGNVYFFLGEAKFLTDYGGHQTAQFEDALRTASFKKKNCIGMAILDGVVWIKSDNKMHRRACSANKLILSSLLLKDFLIEVDSGR
ncbi:MAG: restriction endonuclease [Candidatus Omnitrophota bacterium]